MCGREWQGRGTTYQTPNHEHTQSDIEQEWRHLRRNTRGTHASGRGERLRDMQEIGGSGKGVEEGVNLLGRGDDTVGSPCRAQIYQFELFELILSFDSSSSRSLSSNSRQRHLGQKFPLPLLLRKSVMCDFRQATPPVVARSPEAAVTLAECIVAMRSAPAMQAPRGKSSENQALVGRTTNIARQT